MARGTFLGRGARALPVVVALLAAAPVLAQDGGQPVGGSTWFVEAVSGYSSHARDEAITIAIAGNLVRGTSDSVTIGGTHSVFGPGAEVRVEEVPAGVRVTVDGAVVFEGDPAGDLHALAEAGDAEAALRLATGYLDGDILPRDAPRGMRMLREQAEGGDPDAALELARRIHAGDGVMADMDEARLWAERGIEGGAAGGEALLGQMLLMGEGGPADPERALPLLERAAGEGDMWGQLYLGLAYGRGMGVPVDLDRAVGLYRLSAEQGSLAAMRNLVVVGLNSDFALVQAGEALDWLALLEEAEYNDSAELRRLFEEWRARIGETPPLPDPAPPEPEPAPDPDPAPADAPRLYYMDAASWTPIGPLTLAEFRAARDSGRIGPDTPVWEPGMEGWAAAGGQPAFTD